MSEQIDELLVGLGIDTDARSFQQAQSHFNGLRSAAIQFAGVIGAGMGVDSLTRGFASANDQLGKFSTMMGVAPSLVDSLGYALERSGGQASDAMSSISNMASIIDDAYRGETSRLDAAAMFGLDPRVILEAESMADAYERLADATSGMGTDQRRRVLESLGLGSLAEITLFSGGSEALREYFDEAQRLAPMTRELTNTAEAFNDELSRAQRTLKGVSDEISAELLPGLIEFSTWLRTFVTDNKGLISEFITDGPEAVGRRYGERAREWVGEQINENAPWLGDLLNRADDATDTKAAEAIEQTQRWLRSMGRAEASQQPPPASAAPNVSREASENSDPIGRLLDAVKTVESGGRHVDPDTGELTTNPRTGARGAYQIMPDTARDPGYGVEPLKNDTEEEHRRFAQDYLTALLNTFGDVEKALAAYNWGPGNVRNAGDDWRATAPRETIEYVPKVVEALDFSPQPAQPEQATPRFNDVAALSGTEISNLINDGKRETAPDTAGMPTVELPGSVPDVGDLRPDELDYQPTQSELIPESDSAAFQQGNRRLMRNYFPEQYQGNATNTYNISIDGAGDPRAVALEVERVLRHSAETSARDFSSSVT